MSQNSNVGKEIISENLDTSSRKRKSNFQYEKIKLKREDLELKHKYINSRLQSDSDPKKLFCDMLYTEIKDLDIFKFRLLRKKY